MKNQSKRPISYALALCLILPQVAAAQEAATQQVGQPTKQDPHQGHGDAHATHGTPVPKEQGATRQAPQLDHAAMGHGSPASAAGTAQSAPRPKQVQDEGHGEAHAGHMTPAPPVPPGQEKATAGQGQPVDHAAMGHGPATGSLPAATHGEIAQPGRTSATPGGAHDMQMGRMQGGPPPADARDPSAYNEGTRFAHLGNHEMNDSAPFWKVLVDKAEAAKGDGERGQNVELEAWYGNDYNKAWVKVEGERRGGALEAARTELLWDRAFAPFWSTQLGIRHDSGEGPSRNWLAFGVQGLAPYWFETEATAYWRPGGGFAARLNAKYEILFTSRLILEPEVSANLYSRSDLERGTGSGLSDINAGLRLRYEVTRQFAPYVGVTWSRQFGRTADITRQSGGDRNEVQAVAGVRFWF